MMIKSAATVLVLTLTFVLVGCGLQDGTTATVPSTTPAASTSSADAGTNDTTAPTTTTDAGTTTADTGTMVADTGIDSGVDAKTDSGAYLPAPVMSPAANQLTFATYYVAGSLCGDVLGTLPGMNWTSGRFITDASPVDGRLELVYTASPPVGDYTVSYRDRACPTESPDRTNWALYGAPEMLKAMTPAARAWLQCNWWDATSKTVLTVADPVCNIKLHAASGGVFTGAGNMENFK